MKALYTIKIHCGSTVDNERWQEVNVYKEVNFLGATLLVHNVADIYKVYRSRYAVSEKTTKLATTLNDKPLPRSMKKALELAYVRIRTHVQSEEQFRDLIMRQNIRMGDYKAQYSADIDRFGNIEITDNDTGKSCYLQGDDAIDLREGMEYMENIEYPSGPFTCYEMHLDAILSDYSEIME